MFARWAGAILVIGALLLWPAGNGLSGGTALAMRQEVPPATSAPCPTGVAGEEGCVPSGEVAEQLPPPHLPTSDEQGFQFKIEATLTADLDAVPTEAPVYELHRASWSEEQATALAERLGVDGDAEDRGGGGFAFSGDGQLFVTPDLVQYISDADPGRGGLPDDAAAITAAREWLRRVELTPADLGEGRVATRDEASKRLVVLFIPAEPANVLAAFPSISLAVGPGGEVLEVTMRWPTIKRADVYRLGDVELAWFRVEASEVFLDASLDGAGLSPGSEVAGTVEYSEVNVVYTTAGPPNGDQYLEPVFMFRGRLSMPGKDQTFPITAYVPALASSGAPVGGVGGGTAA